MDTDRVEAFLATTWGALSSVETTEVRGAVLPSHDLPDVAPLRCSPGEEKPDSSS